MKLWVGVTDRDWYQYLSQRPHLDEVNFWQPGGNREFSALSPGELFLFKLHYPENVIVGGGFFEVGCIILEQPFFLDRPSWITVPSSFAKNIVQGKTYDVDSQEGRMLWNASQAALRAQSVSNELASEGPRPVYGEPILVRPRIGQGAFRVLVTDKYQRRCAVTREKALPVLQAAHIKPVAEGGQHQVDNGLLLRSDIHALFDRGYVTVSPELQFRVSHRLKADFDNGENYFRLQGTKIWVPPHVHDQPSREVLEWHADTVFLR
jgi:putative restriction endonuclease